MSAWETGEAGGRVRAGGGGAGRGCGGRGRARACQRVPSFIYDVKSMSLSAGLWGEGEMAVPEGWTQGPASTWPSQPTPCRTDHFLRFILGTRPLGCAYCLSPSISVTHFPRAFFFFYIFV